jgi:hypothetical protein
MRIRATDPRPCPQCGNVLQICLRCHDRLDTFFDNVRASMNCRQNLPVGPHPADAFGGQAHGLSRVSLRPVRDGGQVAQFAALAHVATAPRHQHQGPARRPHARPVRSCFGFLPAGQGRRQR